MPSAPEVTHRRPALSRPDATARSSADDAAHYIRRLIFDGELGAGTRIPQDDIASALGRSRIPIREALIALEREGWVTLVLNRGAYVSVFTPNTIRDHYELLGFSYGLAARRAVERNLPDLDERLAEIAESMKDTEDLDGFNRATLRFHAAVVDAAGSPRIRSVLRSISAIVPGNFFREVAGAAAVERRGTARIRRAIAAGDGDKAALEYQKMLRLHGEQAVELLASRGFFEQAVAEPT